MPLQQNQVLDQHLTLCSAVYLLLSDFSVAGSKSDPCISLKLNGTKPHRPCLKNTLNPVRDPPEHYIFPVAGRRLCHAQREVYDKDTLNPDDLVCVLVPPVPTCKLADEMDMLTLEFGDRSGWL